MPIMEFIGSKFRKREKKGGRGGGELQSTLTCNTCQTIGQGYSCKRQLFVPLIARKIRAKRALFTAISF